MSNLLTNLVVEPETGVNLADIDPTGGDFEPWAIGFPDVQPLAQVSDPPRLPNFHEKFIARPGRKVNLGEIDPSCHHGYETREAAVTETRFLLWKLDQLQYLMHAERKHSL